MFCENPGVETCGVNCDPEQQLSYEFCNADNQGCLQCEEGKYKSGDFCQECGGDCAVGFYGDNCSEGCGTVAFNSNCSGCFPCENKNNTIFKSSGQIHGNASSCEFSCESGYYCLGGLNADNVCSGVCQKCTEEKDITCPPGQIVSDCLSNRDRVCQNCSKALSTGSMWTQNNSCAISCLENFYLRESLNQLDDECTPCFDDTQDPPCETRSGKLGTSLYRKQKCGSNQSLYRCKFCDQDTNNEKIEMIGVGDVCKPICKIGRYWSYNNSATNCEPCTSKTVCQYGEKAITCSPWENTKCVACQNTLNENEEYVKNTNNIYTCQTICKSGFYRNADQCQSCNINCDPGTEPSKDCTQVDDRLLRPECVSCTQTLVANEIFFDKCRRRCRNG